jgi:hypothetical protein
MGMLPFGMGEIYLQRCGLFHREAVGFSVEHCRTALLTCGRRCRRAMAGAAAGFAAAAFEVAGQRPPNRPPDGANDTFKRQSTVVAHHVSHPRLPQEVGYFIPPDPTQRYSPMPEGHLVAQTEDVLVDRRGFIYITDKNQGLWVLKY